ncbi:signal peptide peptidase-domain-containing protein [Boletus reticuloceps]|uniref:Signal peptide peptidase-domain-containing protein n=1 Tax=Boletus reticuloceps TaxID=495285 RepID=A0A8I2YTP4_9AGAM|nr:signal peptide peptidase-domain-containing protein [Boletus reticuloceps]
MQGIDWDVVSSYAGLLCLASVSIYCGAFGSLPISPHERTGSTKSLLQDDEDEEEDIPDRMSSGDAWLFPIVGSLALFGIYAVVKYMGKEWINWFLGWYFSIIGVGSVWKLTVSLAKFVIGREDGERSIGIAYCYSGAHLVISLSFRTPTLVLFPLGILPSILYSFSAGSRKSALLTDIFALSFSHNTLSILKLDSFKTGCILLSALFVYDIFWVFFTEVMVKVATSLDVPIKLLWPKSMIFATEKGFTMLGLGDVVIPGLFIALALRYDQARAEKMKTSFTKPYFSVTLTAYVVGLVTTMTVMHMMGKAQPALLYLSPACILSLFVTAVVRGEVDDVWSWSDDPELSPKKAAQEASLVSRALPKVENGNSAPQPGSSADGGHEEAEVTEGDEEEETGEAEEGQEEVKRKKRKSRGKKKA